MGARPLTDAELAAELAEEAGRILLDLRANGGLEDKALGEAGDRLANRYLIDRLAAERPLPGLGLVLRSDKAVPPAAHDGPPRMLVSRTRPAAEALAVAEALGCELVPMGSAGAKAMAVVLGQAEIYLHSGGQYEWDNCAPVAVAKAHGLHCSRIDGSPLVYNRKDTYLPDLVICRPEWAERALAVVAAL